MTKREKQFGVHESRSIMALALAALVNEPSVTAQSCRWEALAGASTFDMGRMWCLGVHDDGAGPALYVGGTFRESLGGPGNHIARWDGSEWSALGTGIGNSVYALEVFDDGTGAALYVGGFFRRAGEEDGNGIARWDGKAWSTLSTGMYNPGPFGSNRAVKALAVFDDGSGPALYAGGRFIEAGGVLAINIARWDGASWAPVGNGLTLAGSSAPEVMALAAYDDGSGPVLYASGAIDGGVQRWDGRTWEVVGTGLAGLPETLCAYDDGSGSALYVGGQMLYGTTQHIMRWDGADWSGVGGDVNFRVRSMCAYDGGTGSGLYVGGAFSQAGTIGAWGIARWDGAWSALGSGLYHHPWGPSADALSVFDDGSGPALYAGGEFTVAGSVSANSIARWRCESCYADCDGSRALDVFDFLCFQDAFVANDPYTDCDGNGSYDILDFLCFQRAFVVGCP